MHVVMQPLRANIFSKKLSKMATKVQILVVAAVVAQPIMECSFGNHPMFIRWARGVPIAPHVGPKQRNTRNAAQSRSSDPNYCLGRVGYCASGLVMF